MMMLRCSGYAAAYLLAALALTGCSTSGGTPADASPETPPTASPETPPTKSAAPDSAGSDLVEVSAEGTRFDPPVLMSRIPKGAWMCNMGKVHYAATDKGDGSCPVCGMSLEQHE